MKDEATEEIPGTGMRKHARPLQKTRETDN